MLVFTGNWLWIDFYLSIFCFCLSPSSHLFILSPPSLLLSSESLPPRSVISHCISNFLPWITFPFFCPLLPPSDCWSRQVSTSTDRPKRARPCMKLPCVGRPRQWDSCWRLVELHWEQTRSFRSDLMEGGNEGEADSAVSCVLVFVIFYFLFHLMKLFSQG